MVLDVPYALSVKSTFQVGLLRENWFDCFLRRAHNNILSLAILMTTRERPSIQSLYVYSEPRPQEHLVRKILKPVKIEFANKK
jgi:hypothetical protein